MTGRAFQALEKADPKLFDELCQTPALHELINCVNDLNSSIKASIKEA